MPKEMTPAIDEAIVAFAGLIAKHANQEKECSYLLVDSVRVLSVIVTTRRRLESDQSAAAPFGDAGRPIDLTVE